MLRLTSLKEYKSPEKIQSAVNDLRHTFAIAFSNTYAEQLAPALNKAVTHAEYKPADDFKDSEDATLKGFSDLLSKEKFFKKPLSQYTNKDALKTVFQEIFQGAGFDDEAAFILAFYAFNSQNKTARAHYEEIKSRLTTEDCNEVEAYLDCLGESKRELLEVNFLSLVDKNNKTKGFAIYHLFQDGNTKILHARQAAMCQVQGYLPFVI